MRTDNRSLVLATLGGLCTAMACTLIADVDRQQIKPPPNGEGGQGASGGSAGKGGSGGKGGMAGKGGAGGSSGGSAGGSAGKGGTAGSGGTVQGGQGGEAGEDVGGAGGESGAPAVCGNGVMEGGEACDDGNTAACGTCSADCGAVRIIPAGSDGTITIGPGTNIADGDTVTIGDGTDSVVLEFECDPVGDCPGGTVGVGSGNVAVTFNATNFDGTDDADEYRDLLIAAIDGAGLTTDASVGGPGVLTLDNVVTLSDTVGAPTFVPAVRCRPSRGCVADQVCLSNDCTANVCQ